MSVPIIISRALIYRDGARVVQPPNPDNPQPPLNPNLPAQSIGAGIRLNGLIIGGVKRLIEINDVLDIPVYWEYNVHSLDVDGVIENEGEINII